MCGNNPNVAPQVNNAKCIGGTALGFAIVTIVGFLLDWPGAISAIAGILSVIGNSIVCCCGRDGDDGWKVVCDLINLFLVVALTFYLIVMIPTIIFALIAGILEAVAAAKCSAAKAAILADGPSTASV